MTREYLEKDKFEEFVKKLNPHYLVRDDDEGIVKQAIFSYPGKYNSNGEKPAVMFERDLDISTGVMIKSCLNFEERTYIKRTTKKELLWMTETLKKLADFLPDKHPEDDEDEEEEAE